MNNKRTDKSMFHFYFSDFYSWNACVAVLFIVSYTLTLIRGNSWGRCWVIPVCFLVFIFLSIKYYILFFTAVQDLKGNHIEEVSVHIQQAVQDKKFNFYTVGLVGHERCLLIDSDAAKYRVVLGRNKIIESHPSEYYSGAQIRIVYLSKSRIVLSMKTLSSDNATKHLHKLLSEYFA